MQGVNMPHQTKAPEKPDQCSRCVDPESLEAVPASGYVTLGEWRYGTCAGCWDARRMEFDDEQAELWARLQGPDAQKAGGVFVVFGTPALQAGKELAHRHLIHVRFVTAAGGMLRIGWPGVRDPDAWEVKRPQIPIIE